MLNEIGVHIILFYFDKILENANYSRQKARKWLLWDEGWAE